MPPTGTVSEPTPQRPRTAAGANFALVRSIPPPGREPITRLFEPLLLREASGRSWLPALLEAMPRGREQLGELAEDPGWLVTPLAVRGVSGELGGFDYRLPPPREMLAWYVEHPEALSWQDEPLSREARLLRRLLVEDEPAGAREKAQERAHELLRTRSPLTPGWWRFEEPIHVDCVLVTHRLVLGVVGGGGWAERPVTGWYPARSRLVRVTEAARQLADGRVSASVIVGGDAPRGSRGEREAWQPGAPYLPDDECAALAASCLGHLSWETACATLGVPLESILAARDAA